MYVCIVKQRSSEALEHVSYPNCSYWASLSTLIYIIYKEAIARGFQKRSVYCLPVTN